MTKLNIISACGFVKLLFLELPEHLILINEILRFLQQNNLELTEDIEQFNSVFWPTIFTLYDVKILNTDDESTIAFAFHNEKLGIALGHVFNSI